MQNWEKVPKSNTWKSSIGSPVQYLVKVVYVLKSNTRKRFKGPIPFLGNYFRFPSPCSTGKRFYKFPNPTLEKGSIGSPVQSWVKVVYVLKSNTRKRF